MRLSDAIALGRTLVAPAGGAEWYDDGSGCARGMALAAIGRRRPVRQYANVERFHDEWPWTFTCIPAPPCQCYQAMDSVAGIITHLFDVHIDVKKDWTLDQLIDWVRSVEPAEPPAPSLTEGANSLADARTERVAGEAKGVGV